MHLKKILTRIVLLVTFSFIFPFIQAPGAFANNVTYSQFFTQNQSASATDLIAFVKSRLSSYKAPRHILFAPIKRGPNAKPDLPSLQAFANEQLATHLKETS
jgi:hypothetical protein